MSRSMFEGWCIECANLVADLVRTLTEYLEASDREKKLHHRQQQQKRDSHVPLRSVERTIARNDTLNSI